MKRFVAAAFRDRGKLVLQRRDSGAPNNPNTLGFFGGLIEPKETPKEALKREITEETDLDISELELKYLFDVEIPIGSHDSERGKDYVFECQLPSPDFRVKEGKGAEAYTFQELTLRDDIAPFSQIIINKLAELGSLK